MKPRVLLLSAYCAASHQLWGVQLQRLFPDYTWTVLASPPRHFNWTIRGNSLLWAHTQQAVLNAPYELLIATSMVDLSSLRGMVPALSAIPTIVYFHENQFAYPAGRQRDDNVEPRLVPLYAALCADEIVFNSHYNRDSFLQGSSSLFKLLPDSIPPQVSARLQRSHVIPVPVLTGPGTSITHKDSWHGVSKELLEVVWNHRWEYDKGIDLLQAVCQQITTDKLPIRMHIAGEQFRQQPDEFTSIDALLDQHARNSALGRGQFGYVAERADYDRLLAHCDVVLSTARHDFQGLAVQEACLAGCTPLTPDALVYPEYLDPKFLYTVAEKVTATAASICSQLMHWQAVKAGGNPLPKVDLQEYRETAVRPRYAALFEELMRVTD